MITEVLAISTFPDSAILFNTNPPYNLPEPRLYNSWLVTRFYAPDYLPYICPGTEVLYVGS